METKPTLEEFRELATRGNTIPVSVELLADTETPVSAYMKLRSQSGGYSFLFESVEGGERAGRYSFLGIAPHRVFRSKGQQISQENCQTGERDQWQGDAVEALKELTRNSDPVHVEGLPRFTGGAVGYLGYDGIRLVEDIPDSGEDDLQVDDMVFAVYETILAFDNLRHTVLLIANADLSRHADVDAAYAATADELRKLEVLLAAPAPAAGLTAGRGMGTVRSNMSRQEYVKSVERCLEYIRAGDIFQVVFSQRFSVDVESDPLDIYRMLRTVNPSPYMFHMAMDGLQILGASPEILVRVEGGTIDLRPIAGTRPRGKSEEQDAQLESELLADAQRLRRARHAGGPGAQRCRPGLPISHRRSDGDDDGGALLPRHAHRLQRARQAAVRHGLGRCAFRLLPGGHPVGGAEDPGDGDHR